MLYVSTVIFYLRLFSTIFKQCQLLLQLGWIWVRQNRDYILCQHSTSGGLQVRTELHNNSHVRLTLLFLEPRSRIPFWEHSLLQYQTWGRAGRRKNATKLSYHLKFMFPWFSVQLVPVNLCFTELRQTWFRQLVLVFWCYDTVGWWMGTWSCHLLHHSDITLSDCSLMVVHFNTHRNHAILPPL